MLAEMPGDTDETPRGPGAENVMQARAGASSCFALYMQASLDG